MHRMLVKEIMQHPVITLHADDLLVDAAQLMDEHNIRRLPVVDDDACLLGIVTETDIREAEAAGSVISSYDPAAAQRWLTAGEIMERELTTIGPESTVGQLVQIFLDNKIGGIPVVDENPQDPRRKHLVGIVTEMDIFRMIADSWVQERDETTATAPTTELEPLP